MSAKWRTVSRTGFAGALALMAAWMPSASSAADGDKPAAIEARASENHYYFALGAALVPEYEGAKAYDPEPVVIADWERKGMFARITGAKLRVNLVPMSLWQAGPIVNWRRGRDDVSQNAVNLMRDIDGAFEIGFLFGPELRDPDNPRRRLGLHVEALQDISDVHDSYIVTLKLDGGMPFGDSWMINLSVFSNYAGDGYMDTYFGVDPDDAARSGLRAFDPSPDFKDIGMTAELSYRLTKHWGVSLALRYARLIGSAADSPLVEDVGSADQLVSAFMVTVRY